MKTIIIVIVLIPSLLLSCTVFKPVGKLTDEELIDKYYKTDLKLYMVKRDGVDSTTSESSPKPAAAEARYSKRDISKINKIEMELEIMRQELNKRGYMP